MIMYYIKHTLVFLVAASFVLPLTAQQPTATSKIRVDTSYRIIRDASGNVVGESFDWRIEGYIDNKEQLKAQREQIKAMRATFFSNHINFTSKEAERFWPVYNEYDYKFGKLKNEQRQLLNQLSNFENMNNEKEVKALLDAYVNSRVQESALFQEYYKKFCAILPPSKVVRLYQTEEQFQQALLRYLRGR